MPDTPLNPDAIRVATTAAHDAVDWQMYDVTKFDLEDSVDVATIAAVSAYLAVAQPEVNSLEELEALPVESVVMDKHGYVYLLVDEDDEFRWSRNGLDAKFPSWGIVLPARVLNRPEVKP